MSRAKAIEILVRLRGGFADGWTFDILAEAMGELEETGKGVVMGIEDKPMKCRCIESTSTNQPNQKYRPKCDWCGNYLDICEGIIRDDTGKAFDSWACQQASADHDRLNDLMTWRDKVIKAMGGEG